ncbi:MAG: hypothetical protein QXX06_04125, partial [Candidatus Diapherotrites archaeon]
IIVSTIYYGDFLGVKNVFQITAFITANFSSTPSTFYPTISPITLQSISISRSTTTSPTTTTQPTQTTTPNPTTTTQPTQTTTPNPTTTTQPTQTTTPRINNKPIIVIVDPTYNSVYTETDKITVQTEVFDFENNVSFVEFFLNDQLISKDETSPYSITLENLKEGIYEISAIATDQLGLNSKSNIVKIEIQKQRRTTQSPRPTTSTPQPTQSVQRKTWERESNNKLSPDKPLVIITKPDAGQKFFINQTFEFEAELRPKDFNIEKMEFYINEKLINTDYEAPYSIEYSEDKLGVYTLRAVAVYEKTQTAFSKPTWITITNPEQQKQTKSILEIPFIENGKKQEEKQEQNIVKEEKKYNSILDFIIDYLLKLI